MAGEPGFEPGLTDPESAVLPLDDSPESIHINKLLRSSLRCWGFNCGVGWGSQQLDCVLDTLHTPFFSQNEHGVEEGWRGGATRDRDSECAKELACLDAEVGGEGTQEGFQGLGGPGVKGFQVSP